MLLPVALVATLVLGQSAPRLENPSLAALPPVQVQNESALEVERDEAISSTKSRDDSVGPGIASTHPPTAGSVFRILGWTEGSLTGSSARGDQLPMGFNYEPNEFLVQQNWLRVERTIDVEASEASTGFRIDTILPGSDYRFTAARGLWDQQLTANGDMPARYGIDPVQFFGDAYFPQFGRGLRVQIGRFFSPYGVESIAGTDTPLASRAYNFIYNPFTHTGLLTTLNLSDSVTTQQGIVMGSDVFIDPAARPTYVGNVRWAPPDGVDTLQLSTILGDGRFDPRENFSHPQIFDLVWTHHLNEDLVYSLDALYGFQHNVPGAGYADWIGVVHYLTQTWTPRISGTARVESFYDAEGTRTGSEGLYTAITGGVKVQPIENLILRPELRYDHNSESQPFSGDSSLFTATLDVIVQW